MTSPRHQDIPPKTRKLVNEQIIPFVDEKVEEAGFLIYHLWVLLMEIIIME